MVTIESLMQKIAEQNIQINELQQQNENLKFLLSKQTELKLVSELASMIEAHAPKHPYVIIPSLHKH